MWDKDFNKPDDLVGTSDVLVEQGHKGSMTVRIAGVDGNDDTQALSFSWMLQADEEELVDSDDPRAAAEVNPSSKGANARPGSGKGGKSSPTTKR